MPTTDGSADLLPRGWSEIEDLVCGFGDRRHAPPPGTLLLERQVHGTLVASAAAERDRARIDRDDGLPRARVEADALVATEPGDVVGVRTADCVPLLLIAPRARWAAAVHAGWRGTLGGIASEAVRSAGRAGVRPHEIRAALGPSIGPCCYEVSEDLAGDFARAGLAVDAKAPGRVRPHLDLRLANRLLLERSGVEPAHIQDVGPCTRCATDRYHSFRADPGAAGRQVSWIGWSARR